MTSGAIMSEKMEAVQNRLIDKIGELQTKKGKKYIKPQKVSSDADQ